MSYCIVYNIQDALCLGYSWTPANLSSECVCGATFNTEHALTCKLPPMMMPALWQSGFWGMGGRLRARTFLDIGIPCPIARYGLGFMGKSQTYIIVHTIMHIRTTLIIHTSIIRIPEPKKKSTAPSMKYKHMVDTYISCS